MNFYLCDPRKNKFCKKTRCFMNGCCNNPCHITSKISYSLDNHILDTQEGWRVTSAQLALKDAYEKERMRPKE